MRAGGVSVESRYWTREQASRVSRRRALGIAASAAASLAVLSACGRGGNVSKATPAASGQAGKPKPGGQLNLTMKTDPFDMDPSHKASANHVAIIHTYSSLLAIKSGPSVKYEQLIVEPSLAASWESPDAQTYTFHLRNGAKFADLPPVNGRALVPEDVKWSLEYLSRTAPFGHSAKAQGKPLPPSQYASLYKGIEKIETPDSSTVVVHFAQPYAPFQHYAASDFDSVLPHEIFDKYGDFKDHSVGTGPFQLDTSQTQRGARWVFKKNASYFQEGRPYIDQLNYLVLNDDSAVFAAFKAKQLDKIGGGGSSITTQSANQVKQESPDAVEIDNVSALPWHIYLNVKKPPLDDEHVRQALGFAIDRDKFLKTFFGGKGGWALAGAFPDTYTQAEIRQIVKYDPAQAKQLMTAAGHADGVDIEFIYPGQQYGQLYITAMQLLQQQLKQVGINLTLKDLDKPTESLRKKQGNFQMTFTPKALGGPDIDAYLYAVFYPGSPANYGQIDDPKLKSMLEAQRREVDAAKRQQICRNAVRYIYDHALAFGLYRPVIYEFTQPNFKNYAPNFGRHGGDYSNCWLEK